jgi:hypothetical protein
MKGRGKINSNTQKVRFGKYKGKLCSWVVQNDYQYALWLAYGSNSMTKTKRGIRSCLDKLKNGIHLP